MVENTLGYLSDHWCNRGHIVLVVEGDLVTELQDGRMFTLTPGMDLSSRDGYRTTSFIDSDRS